MVRYSPLDTVLRCHMFEVYQFCPRVISTAWCRVVVYNYHETDSSLSFDTDRDWKVNRNDDAFVWLTITDCSACLPLRVWYDHFDLNLNLLAIRPPGTASDTSARPPAVTGEGARVGPGAVANCRSVGRRDISAELFDQARPGQDGPSARSVQKVPAAVAGISLARRKSVGKRLRGATEAPVRCGGRCLHGCRYGVLSERWIMTPRAGWVTTANQPTIVTSSIIERAKISSASSYVQIRLRCKISLTDSELYKESLVRWQLSKYFRLNESNRW